MEKGMIISSLDFTAMENNRLVMWTKPAFSSYAEGCAIGRLRAEQTVSFMRDHESELVFPRIAQQFIRDGELTAAHIGYLQRISQFLLVG